MKRFIAAAFTMMSLVFAVGCVGAPDSDGAGGNGAAEESNMSVDEDNVSESASGFGIKCPPDSCGFKCLKTVPGKSECRCQFGDDCYW